MNWRVRRAGTDDIEPARQLLAATGWAHRVGDAAWFAELVRRSDVALVAVAEGGAVVGFARAITDGLSNGYLSMLTVAPDWRRQGVGRALMEGLLAHGEPGVTWVLRAGRDQAPDFFARLGFEPSSVAMERTRRAGEADAESG